MKLILIATMLFIFMPNAYSENSSDKQLEIDEVMSLLAMAVVYKDWQDKGLAYDKKRGHNIGSVLVNYKNEPVFWARNTRHASNNASQHGEVRLISNYLSCHKNISYLSGKKPEQNFTLYSTLEPCAMCTGMMMLTQIFKGAYIQADPGYGGVIERLTHDSKHHDDGLKPYPTSFEMVQVNVLEAKALDDGFENGSITKFLTSTKAKAIYKSAYKRFKAYKSKYGNENIVKTAQEYLKNVPDSYTENMSTQCDL